MRFFISKVIRLIILSFLAFSTHSYASVWQKPVLIDAGQESGYRTKLEFDNAGNAFAVFEQKKDGIYRMYANRYVGNGIWEGPTVIDSGIGNAYSGKVAFDIKGNAIAVFKQESAIYASRYIKDSGWQGAVRISNPQLSAKVGELDGQQIAFDSNGNAAVVFEQHDGDAYKIYISAYIANKDGITEAGWQKAVQIKPATRSPQPATRNSQPATRNPQPATRNSQPATRNSQPVTRNSQPATRNSSFFPYPVFDNKGNLYVIYYTEGEKGLNVYVNRYDATSRKWGNAVHLTNGIAGAVTKKADWNNEQSYVARGIKGIYNPQFFNEVKKRIYSGTHQFRSWETPSKLDARFRNAYRPSLLTDKNGNLMALFVKWDGEHLRGYMAIKKFDKDWSAPQLIDAGGNKLKAKLGDIEHLRGAVNSKGEITIVFSRWINESLRIHARIYNPSTGWGKTSIIDAGDKSGFNPSVVYADNSSIVVVWCQWDTTNVKSYSNTYIKGSGWGKAVRLAIKDEETCGVRVAAGPDGKVIAIFEQENFYDGGSLPVNRIYAVETEILNNSESRVPNPYTVKKISRGNSVDYYAEYSASGKQIVYSSLSGFPEEDDFQRQSDSYWNIWTMNAEGTDKIQLTKGDFIDIAPVFTPDGKKIIFASNRSGSANWDIWSVNNDGSELSRLTGDKGQEMSPRPTSDGKNIVYISTEGGPHSVWIMDINGENGRRLTSGGTGDWFPAMNPDGQETLFVSTRLGNGDIWTIDRTGKKYHRLTYGIKPEFSPSWNPDGTKIAYVTKNNDIYDIWVMDRDGSNKRRLTKEISGGSWGSRFSSRKIMDTAGYYHLSWHPDGDKIVLTTWDPDKDGTYITILSFDKDILDKLPVGTKPASEYTLVAERELTSGDWEDFAPCFSPDGNTMIFASNRTGNWDVWSMGFNGNDLKQLTKGTAAELAPVFSPDGKKIAYLKQKKLKAESLKLKADADSYDIWIMNNDGTNTKQLTTEISVMSYPAWKPDGKEIAFISGDKDGPGIWFYNIADGNAQKIAAIWKTGVASGDKTEITANDYPFKKFLYRVDYSASGGRITYESNLGGNIDIWTMQSDGTALTRITSGDMPHWNPVYSPDGKKIAYATAKLGEAGLHNWKNYNIWIADSEMGHETVITGEEQTDWNPVWSPDGKRIAYVTNRSGNFDHFSIWMLYLK